MSTADRDRLRSIRTFPSLVKYLRDELDWPIETDHFEDLTFDYAPEELIPDAKVAAKLQDIKQLRPLTSNQPWGIFFIKFEPKRLPIVVMRRILRSLVIKKRQSAQKAERPYWQMHDLLFVSSYGEQGDRVISFAHFSDPEGESLLPTLRVLAWDDKDTVLHLDHAHETLKAKLRWPDDEKDVESWRTSWGSAFTLRPREVIKTSKKLAVCMAEMATRMRNRANTVLEVETENGPLTKLYKAFQEALIHDLEPDDFADMYAQTITYGLFAAAMSRTVEGEGTALVAENLADMVPVTNPFLKELLGTFLEVGGKRGHIDFDELGVNDVVELMLDADLEAVKRDFGDLRREEDPVIHFYEDFLREYDAKKKIQRGIFFTPQPVVSFIVRSVHEILQKEFGLPDGLADTTTWGEMAERHADLEIPEGVRPDEPFVQILDPACGTGTFLVEVIDRIWETMKAKWRREGHMDLDILDLWNEYVPKHLLPRLYGFELMMAPYTICHMKVGLKLGATGYRFGADERLRVCLTNSLEPPRDFSDMFEQTAPALAHEARAANEVKQHVPTTVIVGNPPYSKISANLTPDARAIIDRYRYVAGERLKERGALQFEINLQDDYVKFIRTGEQRLEGGLPGVLALITNNGYISTPTLRGMRWSLRTTFGRISIADLHGHLAKGERGPDARPEENVFEILQGVAVILARRLPLACAETIIDHVDLFGSRAAKYKWLSSHSYLSGKFEVIQCAEPFYRFAPQDLRLGSEFRQMMGIQSLFPKNSAGVITARDGLVVDWDDKALLDRVRAFRADSRPAEYVFSSFNFSPSKRFDLRQAQKALGHESNLRQFVRPILHRPFDRRHIFYHPAVVWSLARPAAGQMAGGPNLALIATRQVTRPGFEHAFVSREMIEIKACSHDRNTQIFPLYLYVGWGKAGGSPLLRNEPSPNLDPAFVADLATSMSLKPCSSGSGDMQTCFGPDDVLHYVYGVLHSPAYRERYFEFLKSEFPRVPRVANRALFWALAGLGADLVALHLLEDDYPPASWNRAKTASSNPLKDLTSTWVGESEAEVATGHPKYADSSIFVSKVSCFTGVSKAVWDFRIGGYQVCRKWLKDRQAKGGKNPRAGRVLTDEDIEHYQKILVAISETIRIMGEIDQTIEEHGGWPDAFITEPLDTEPEEASRAVSASPPAGKAEKRQNPGKGNFKLRPNTRTVTGRLNLSARKEEPQQRSRGKAPSITDFDRDQLKEAVLEVVGTDWIERDDAIRAAAQSLGFKRTGKRIHKAFASAITGLLRQKKLESAGSQIRRA